jgi:hypothetical protein
MAMDSDASSAVTVSGPGDAVALDPAARAELSQAIAKLDKGGGLVVRLADLLGGAMGRTVQMGARTMGVLPGVGSAMRNVAEVALRRAFEIAILRLDVEEQQTRSRRLAAPLVVLSGAVGGFVGLGGFVPDAAVTSLTIMREIGRIAQQEGEDLDDEDTRAACLQVFALNPGNEAGREPEMSYFSARLMMQGRPLAMLLGEVAARYGITLSQKFALQAVPVVGAIGGATLNAAFLRHYRDLAQAHFTIRRLERTFGEDAVRAATVRGVAPPP